MGYVYRKTQGAQAARAERISPKVAEILKAKDGEIARLMSVNGQLAEAQARAEDRLDEARKKLREASRHKRVALKAKEGLEAKLAEVTAQAEASAREVLALRVETERPSLAQVLEEELKTEKAKTANLMVMVKELQWQMRKYRRQAEEASSRLDALLAEQRSGHEPAGVTVSTKGVELHGAYTEAPVEEIVGSLNRAFELFVRGSSTNDVLAARS